VDRVDYLFPLEVEYASKRSYGPTLVIWTPGTRVMGQIMVTDIPYSKANLAMVHEWVRSREGTRPEWIKVMKIGQWQHVVYCDIEPDLADPTPELLAKLAIESVHVSVAANKAKRNGVAYLRARIKRGIITPLTYAYRDCILRMTGTSSLKEAEEKLFLTCP